MICKKFDIYGLNHRFLSNVFLIVSYNTSTFQHLDGLLLLVEPFADNMYGKFKSFPLCTDNIQGTTKSI